MSELTLRTDKPSPVRRVLSLLFSAVMGAPDTRCAAGTRPKKILIVDDDAVILKTLSSKLEPRGYTVVTAMDASEAIAAVRDELPDLILLDIGFPPDVAHGGQMAWDGFQIMSWLHGFKEAGSIPFIIITGVDLAEYSQRSLAGIAAASFRKPINHKELLLAIKRLLD